MATWTDPKTYLLIRSAFVFALCCVPVAAFAGNPVVLTVDDKGNCKVDGSPTTEAQAVLDIKYPAGTAKDFKMRLSSGDTVEPEIDTASQTKTRVQLKIDTAEAQCAPFGGLTFKVVKEGDSAPSAVTCPDVPLFLECKDRLAQEDARAQKFWNRKGPTAIDYLKNRGMNPAFAQGQRPPRKTVYMVHLPSGMPAFPSPGSLTEGTPVQVVILASANSPRRYSLTVNSCAAINSFRTTISGPTGKDESEKQDDKNAAEKVLVKGLGAEANDGIKKMDDLLDAGTDGEQVVEKVAEEYPKASPQSLRNYVVARQAVELASEKMQLIPIGQWFQCGAGDMTYQLDAGVDQIGASGASNHTNVSVRIRPKYHVAAIALLGYDTAKKDGFATASETGPDGTSRAIIAREKDRVGTSLYVGGVWMMGGVDYENFRWWNWFANIFLAVNPKNPLHDACAGLALTPTGGVSLAVGMSVHPGRVLKAGFVEGAVFTGQGDVPTRESWSDVNFGVVAGLAVDSRIYDSLSKTFANK